MEKRLSDEVAKIREEFVISNTKLVKIANDFYNDMTNKNMLKMLRTFVEVKTDKALNDYYLSIDLGGSNIRISKVKVEDDNVSIEKMIKLPLRTKFTNYTTIEYSLKDLFVIILKKISPFLDKDKTYSLGVTISFGLLPNSKMDAKIIELSKGFELSHTLGENVYEILKDAIQETKLKVIPSVIMNDCVATLATGRFYNPNADISLIVGTGHNACFINSQNEVINIESANFNKDLPLTRFDKAFLSDLPKDADKLLEVLVGGKYICGICNKIFSNFVEKDMVKPIKMITTKDMISVLSGDFNIKYSTVQKEVICEISKMLFERSAKLIVAEILGILMFVDRTLERKHTVTFDGSVYEKCDFFRNEISAVLDDVLLDNSKGISHKLIKDASSIGPVVISATI